MAQKRSGNKKKKENSKNEIVGIILIGLAVFTALTVYFRIGSVAGDVIKSLIFGVCGAVGYVVPIIIGIAGVLCIMASSKNTNTRKLVLLGLALFFVFALLHISVVEKIYSTGMDYGTFIGNSFSIGITDMAGGGVIGALPTYWVYIVMGLVGSYIVFIVGLAASFLMLTNLSLKKMGKNIGAAVKTGYDGYKVKAEERKIRVGERKEEKREKKNLYVENLELEPEEKEIKKKESRFNKKIKSLDKSINKQFEHIKREEENLPEIEYDPKPYRQVFNGTDIQFEDTPTPVVKGRRRLDSVKTESKDDMWVTASRRAIKVTPEIVSGVLSETDNPKAKQASDDLEFDSFESADYTKPPVSFLSPPLKPAKNSASDLRKNVEILENTLKSFNVEAKVVNVSHGPVVTRFEVQPATGVKVSRIVSLSDDIAMNLSARDVRIEAPVPGKPVVGIEIPNSKTTFVGIRELIDSDEFNKLKSPVAFALGKDIAGANVYGDIAKMPHMLIAGATGSGKSVCINSIITSMLYHASPEDVRMIMIDPKMVELNAYNDIPHLMIPVVTEPKKASSALNWAVNEMTQRYRLFANRGAKDLLKYNSIITAEGQEKLPYLVVIVDELADLMMVALGEVEEAICRIAQLGRASGIHLVVATQRPSVNVITGVIKANIPSRIAFSVSSQVDSRTILDMQGAEKLLGQGDMLYYPTGAPKPIRLQGCFISETEVEEVTNFLKEKSETNYDTSVMEGIESGVSETSIEKPETDALFMKAVETILEYDQASASMLQRRLRIGFSRAGRLMDQLEEHRIVSPADGSKPRQILISREQFESMKNSDVMGNDAG